MPGNLAVTAPATLPAMPPPSFILSFACLPTFAAPLLPRSSILGITLSRKRSGGLLRRVARGERAHSGSGGQQDLLQAVRAVAVSGDLLLAFVSNVFDLLCSRVGHWGLLVV